MKTLRIILGDQLSESIATLKSLDKENDTVMICEVIEEATYVPHHPKKIAFLFSAMRHFAKHLEERGMNVRYIKLDDPKNTGSFSGEVARAIHELCPANIILTDSNNNPNGVEWNYDKENRNPPKSGIILFCGNKRRGFDRTQPLYNGNITKLL